MPTNNGAHCYEASKVNRETKKSIRWSKNIVRNPHLTSDSLSAHRVRVLGDRIHQWTEQIKLTVLSVGFFKAHNVIINLRNNFLEKHSVHWSSNLEQIECSLHQMSSTKESSEKIILCSVSSPEAGLHHPYLIKHAALSDGKFRRWFFQFPNW